MYVIYPWILKPCLCIQCSLPTARRTKMSLWCESMCVCVEGILGIIHIIAKNIHAIGCASSSWNSMKIQLRSFKIFRGALPRTPPGRCPRPRWGAAPDPGRGCRPEPHLVYNTPGITQAGPHPRWGSPRASPETRRASGGVFTVMPG